MSKRPETAPTLLKLCAGSITGWWTCLRCGWQLPGELNPSNHSCRADKYVPPKRKRNAKKRRPTP